MTTITAASTLTKNQKKIMPVKLISYYGEQSRMRVEIRYDDECGNGHNTFAITADINPVDRRKGGGAGGCLHDEIRKHFPELAPFIKWHLCSSDGPMHYIANTVFHAGNRDCWGKLKGEPRSFSQVLQFGKNPIKHKLRSSFAKFLQDHAPKEVHQFSAEQPEGYDFEVIRIDHENRKGETYKFGPKYTFGGYADKWHECPFDTEPEALEFLEALQTCEPEFISIPTSWGEGKERDLDAARHCAVWPDATNEELTAPGLEQRLKDRLPALLTEFRQAVEFLGFVW